MTPSGIHGVLPVDRWTAAAGHVALGIALLSLTLVSACVDSEETPARASVTLPEWIVRVEPAPGQETSALRRVEVHHTVTTDGQSVRLSIDDTDVTAYADFGREDNVGGPGTLVYEFERARDFVALDPGEHTATVMKVRFTGIGEQYDVLESFSWTFTIQ